jgi:hypothetical protein
MAVIRLSYVCAFAALASLGEAAAARPAWLWMKSQGLFQATPARDVRFGAVLFGAGALLGLVTLRMACGIALRRRPGPAFHAALVLLAGICCSLRYAAVGPQPSPDPGPALLEGLRAAATALDASYAGQYLPDAAALAQALARVPSPPIRRLGRPIPLRARILSGAGGPRLDPLEGDPPGTLYVATSGDRQRAWLTVLSLDGALRLPSGRPAMIAAQGGTHALPGRDPALPVYPGARNPVRCPGS